jgi:O-antigen/teichoic acid export membrane protein
MANVLGVALVVPTMMLVARHLGPGRYGKAQLVVMCLSYAGLVRSGAFEGAARAFMGTRSEDRAGEARRVQNVGVTVETAVSAMPGVVLAGFAFVVEDDLVRQGLLLAPALVTLASFTSFCNALHLAQKEFRLAGVVSVLRSATTALVTVVGVWTIGPLGIVIGPAAADVVALVLMWRRGKPLGLRLTFDRQITSRVVREGFPLGVAAVVYWAYRLVGSTSVAIADAPAVFAQYVFAAMPVGLLVRSVGTINTVLMPTVWAPASEDDPSWLRLGSRATVSIVVIAGLLANVAQAVYGPAMVQLLPRFEPSVAVFEVLALTVPLLCVTAVPSLLLDSPAAGKQVAHLSVWAAGLVLNVALNVAVIAFGGGLLGIAWVDVLVQAGVAWTTFRLARHHLGGDAGAPGFALLALGAAFACGAVMMAVPGDALSTVPLRLVIVGVVWLVLGTAYRRRSSA